MTEDDKKYIRALEDENNRFRIALRQIMTMRGDNYPASALAEQTLKTYARVVQRTR
jgi:hypothetical protein